MELQPFKLERWFAEHEFKVEYNLCASCAGVTTTRELLELAGGEVTADYHALGLDYIPSEGTPGLRKAIAGTYNGLGTEEVRVTTGASEAIFILMNVLLRPGDEIIVQTPVYQSLFSVAQGIGCRVRFWPAPMENGFLPSPEMLKALITENTKALVINNPNSPTGAVFPEDYLTRLAEIAEDHDLLLVADEVYRGLVLGTGMSNVSPC